MNVIIGGSGFYDFIDNPEPESIETPFGTVEFDTGTVGGKEVAFLPRHGKNHSISPSKINYRANIFAAHLLNAESILTTNAVGSLHEHIPPGSITVPDQIIDFTYGRASTFFDGSGLEVKTRSGRRLSGVVHTDVTHPYDPDLRETYLQAGSDIGLDLYDGGTMIVYNGPRYETAAEIKAARILGAHFAGMTSAPEAFLAKELEIPYATIAVITNFGAGMQSSISHDEVDKMFKEKIDTIKSLFTKIVTSNY